LQKENFKAEDIYATTPEGRDEYAEPLEYTLYL
jgi:hypothetical protein